MCSVNTIRQTVQTSANCLAYSVSTAIRQTVQTAANCLAYSVSTAIRQTVHISAKGFVYFLNHLSGRPYRFQQLLCVFFKDRRTARPCDLSYYFVWVSANCFVCVSANCYVWVSANCFVWLCRDCYKPDGAGVNKLLCVLCNNRTDGK